MDKIKYRLVYNRKKKLNNQGTALIQIESKLNKRNMYMTTNIYIRPEQWDEKTSQIVNHPQANDLNALLYEKIIELQGIELSIWKRNIQPTLSLLHESTKKHRPTNITFIPYARYNVKNSDKRPTTQKNLLTTINTLEKFRPRLDFPDLTYTFIKEFEHYLNTQGNTINTIAKHLRQVRTLINEAICEGYIPEDKYPFRKYKIKQEQTAHIYLTPDELKALEKLHPAKPREQHVLDAFLFCCYTGIRFSDFRQLKSTNIITINTARWLSLKMQKTQIDIKLPLTLLFDGKALDILDKYESVEKLAAIPFNSETNQITAKLGQDANIKKHFTFHTSRHTCATLLIYDGVPLTTVQKILGHTSIKTTQIYSEIMSDTIVKDLKSVKKKEQKKQT